MNQTPPENSELQLFPALAENAETLCTELDVDFGKIHEWVEQGHTQTPNECAWEKNLANLSTEHRYDAVPLPALLKDAASSLLSSPIHKILSNKEGPLYQLINIIFRGGPDAQKLEAWLFFRSHEDLSRSNITSAIYAVANSSCYLDQDANVQKCSQDEATEDLNAFHISLIAHLPSAFRSARSEQQDKRQNMANVQIFILNELTKNNEVVMPRSLGWLFLLVGSNFVSSNRLPPETEDFVYQAINHALVINYYIAASSLRF